VGRMDEKMVAGTTGGGVGGGCSRTERKGATRSRWGVETGQAIGKKEKRAGREEHLEGCESF